ncbi:glycosyltransferase [Algibacter sp. 2305UL17-15]|uniref:glycosyltransferase n=1 Tax=Algibacter sp. 2305UL17-15 TaxID=3231268 RepID=UPI003459EEDE
MHILIIAIDNKIPVINYGGTERVIWSLGKELYKLKHKVTFLVKKDSYCDFADVIFYDSTIDLKSQIPDGIDVIHSHSVLNLDALNIPNVFTLHGNIFSEFEMPNNTICISKNHATRNNRSTYVYNGLDWDEFEPFSIDTKRNYFHFLGKATWKVKNLTDAAKIAVKTKTELRVLGGEKWNYENLKRGGYWKAHPLITYHGMVDNNTKMKIMSASKGLIFPVKWHEPFGLAIIESMYAGCPVFGSTYGSLPELINEDVGYVSENVDDLINAAKNMSFSPKTCRDYAVEKFNSKTMALNYLSLYERVINGETLT